MNIHGKMKRIKHRMSSLKGIKSPKWNRYIHTYLIDSSISHLSSVEFSSTGSHSCETSPYCRFLHR